MNPRPSIDSARLLRFPWLCLTLASLGLGLVGTILPLLPTTPFILLAAWAAPKGSPKIEVWLREHSLFGPLLINWHEQRAISLPAKAVALMTLLASWIVLYTLDYSTIFLFALGGLFICVGAFLLARPAPHFRENSHD